MDNPFPLNFKANRGVQGQNYIFINLLRSFDYSSGMRFNIRHNEILATGVPSAHRVSR
ncbi:hypothetical protein D3C71_1803030 [compost metagenome]